MLEEDPRVLFEQFQRQATDYVASPGMMKALELDQVCMKLYPLAARKLGSTTLSNQIRDFGRGLPRRELDELAALLDEILATAREVGLT